MLQDNTNPEIRCSSLTMQCSTGITEIGSQQGHTELERGICMLQMELGIDDARHTLHPFAISPCSLTSFLKYSFQCQVNSFNVFFASKHYHLFMSKTHWPSLCWIIFLFLVNSRVAQILEASIHFVLVPNTHVLCVLL